MIVLEQKIPLKNPLLYQQHQYENVFPTAH